MFKAERDVIYFDPVDERDVIYFDPVDYLAERAISGLGPRNGPKMCGLNSSCDFGKFEYTHGPFRTFSVGPDFFHRTFPGFGLFPSDFLHRPFSFGFLPLSDFSRRAFNLGLFPVSDFFRNCHRMF